MSKTVDEKVVEMRFDNKQFESGVQTSLSTLDKLKQSLNMDGAAKGLENVSAAANNCNMSGLRSAVETVHAKFSAFEVMAVTALANITNSAVNAGKQMLRSLTVEPISQGFGEYELKMGSIQTIMASTGESLDTVNQYLNELNTYADKTIYSFSDMTNNIGKFTNAGVKLEDAVKAIQGISNEAAVSGANANEASRAMYNFAQALSAGYVKLIDWKSIENANMATVEFKNKLLETALALGTVEKVGDKYQSTTTDAKGKVSELFDATSMFNDSLSSQWMTTDVLVKALGDYADETTDIGKKAFAAAQDVKTFTQLMDTLKEAAGSGWATTWEIVFGNFEEAKELWTSVSTVVGGFIDAQSDARNSLLQGWKDLGGRAKLIEALKNAFEGLVSIIKPVREAFREIFPKTTAEQLYSITQTLSNLTARLKLSDEASANLKSTFKGLFAVLDIVKQAFSAVFKAIRPLFGGLDDLGGGILDVTGKIGDWLVKLDETIKKNDIFTKAIQGTISFIKSIPGKIDKVFQSLTGTSLGEVFDSIRKKASDFLKKIKEVFSGFGKIDTKGIDKLSEKTKTAFKPLTTLFDGIKKIFNGIWEFLKKFAPVFSSIASALGKAFGGIGTAIYGALKNADFEKILDLVNSGVLISIGIGIKKFIDSLTGATKNASGFLDSFKGILSGVSGVLGGVKEGLQAWQKDLQANTLLKIAGAVGILALSLVVLSGIDSLKLYDAIAAITVLFADLAGTMMAINKLGKIPAKNSVAFIAMSVSVLILAGALKKLSELDLKGVATGLLGIAGVSATLVIVAKQLSKNSGKLISGSVGLIAFAVAIRLMVKPVKELGALDIASLAKGLVGIGVLCAELVLFLKTANLDKMGLMKGIGLMALAEGIVILTKAVAKFAALDTSAMIKGLAGVGAVLLEIAAFMKLTNNSKGLLSTAIGMTVLGAAMLIFGKAISNIGNLSWGEIAKGLTGIGAALIGVAAAMKLMPGGAKMISASIGMTVLGAAMLIFSSAISSFSGMSWGELAKGLAGMALALAEVVIAMNLMNGSAVLGATATLICAAALGMLVPVLKSLGSMSLADIGKGLLTLAGVFVILGVAGYALSSVVGTIIGLAAAMALIGVAAVAFGAGLFAVSVALSTFSGSVEVLVTAIIDILVGLAKGVPEIVTVLAKSLGEALPALVDCIVVTVKAVLDALTELVPPLVDGLLNIILQVLSSLATYIDPIVESILQIVVRILDGLAAGIPKIIASAINLLKEILTAIFDALGGFDIKTILTATAALTALAAMMTLLTAIAAEAVVATAVLPIIGLNLNKFIENAKPFLAEIQKVDPASLQGAKNLAETVLILTASSIMDSLTSWFTGGNSFLKFGEQLAEFAPYLKQYYTGVRGIDGSVVESSANAAKALSEMAANLPNSGGVLGFLTGENDIDVFGEKIVSFGEAMVKYSETVAGKIDTAAVKTSASAGSILVELSKTLPNVGGVIGFFTGENDLATFGATIVPFGEAMAAYSASVAGKIDPEAVNTSASAGLALSELAKTLPNSGGVVGFFTGENDIDTFGQKIVPFGEAMAAYSASVAGKIDPEAVTVSATAGQALVELAKTLPNAGGVVGFFTGENDLATFGATIVPFGEAMAAYSASVSGKIDPVAVEASATAGTSLSELAKTLPKTDGIVQWFTGSTMSMEDFGAQIVPFGKAMSDYSVSAALVNPEVVIASANAGKALAELANVLPKTDGIVEWFTGSTMSMEDFGAQIVPFGKAMSDYSVSAALVNPEVVIASANAGQALAELANALPKTDGIVEWFTGSTMSMEDFGAQIVPFGKAMSDYSVSAALVNPEVVIASANAGKALAELANALPKTDGIVQWFTGSTMSMEDFGAQIVPFGKAMSDYSVSAALVNPEVVIASANAGKALAELANVLPKTDGIVEWFTGSAISMEDFGKQIVPFGEAMSDYSVSAALVNPEVVIASTNAGKALAELAGALPKTDGISQWFTGSKISMEDFGKQIVPFGEAMADYSASVAGKIDSDAVTVSATAGQALVELANTLPETGGFLDWITGSKSDLESFGETITPFGDAMAAYSASVSGRIDAKAVEASVTAGNSLVELANSLPKTGGLFTWLTGNRQGLDSFGETISPFGEAMGKYSKSVAGKIDPKAVEVSATAGQALVELANTLPKTGGLVQWFVGTSQDLSSFGDGLTAFGNAFVEYYNCVRTINTDKLSSVSSEIDYLVLLAGDMSKLDTSGMKNFGDALKKLGETGIDGFVSAFDNAKNKIQNTASEMLQNFIDGLNNKETYLDNEFSLILESLLNKITEKRLQFKSSSMDLIVCFTDGLTSSKETVTAAVKEILKNMTSLFANKNNDFKNAGKNLVEGFTNGFKNGNDSAVKAATTLASDIISEFRKKDRDFKDAGKNLVKEFTNGFKNGNDSAVKAATTLASDIISELQEKNEDFKDAGKNLVKGFASGIKENTYEAEAKAEAMAAAAAKAAKNELKEHSPSKVGYEIGDYFGVAFVNALDDYTSKAYESGSEVAKSAKNGLYEAISKISDMINSGVDTSPTIRPVLDLTNIERGTNRIHSLFSRTQALSVNAEMSGEGHLGIQNGSSKSASGASFSFTQNNYSPKALSRIDIYRQTKNQFSALKEAIENI